MKTAWIADRTIIAHTVISLFGIGWTWLQNQLALGIVYLVLWLLAMIIWLEWRHTA